MEDAAAFSISSDTSHEQCAYFMGVDIRTGPREVVYDNGKWAARKILNTIPIIAISYTNSRKAFRLLAEVTWTPG